MCGISGYALNNIEQIPNEALVRKMTNTLSHRGPDGEGYFCDEGIAMGMKRLSIIDVEGGQQPIYNEDQSVVIVCNGEIYNFVELRASLEKKGHRFYTNSDVEVIVHLYEDHGPECLQYLRGMFAFALWDKRSKTLFLARDRFGIKPLNYSICEDGHVYFGSEYKAILATNKIRKEVNPQAIHDLFTFGFIRSPRTMLKKVHRLLPGHYLLYSKGKIQDRRYWDIHFPRKGFYPQYSVDVWAERLLEKFRETIKIHLRSDVPISGWLSAGIDSSSVLALAQEYLQKEIPTTSLIFEGNYKHDEAAREKLLHEYGGYQITNQRILCKNSDFEFLPKALWYIEDPLTSGAPILHTVLSTHTSKSFKVVLTGEGSDELFGGYPWYRFNKLMHPFSFLPRGIRSIMCMAPVMRHQKRWPTQVFLAPHKMDFQRYAQLIGLYESKVFDNLFSNSLTEQLKDVELNIDPIQKNPDYKHWGTFEKLQYMEDKSRLCDFITHYLDRLPMSKSLEARVPFLDHELAELTFQIPPELKIKKQREKYILRQAMSKNLPSDIINRKKQGLMAPISRWFESDLPAFARELLSEAQIKQKGYFNFGYVAKMLEVHKSKKWDYARPLMAVLNVQLWDEIFQK